MILNDYCTINVYIVPLLLCVDKPPAMLLLLVPHHSLSPVIGNTFNSIISHILLYYILLLYLSYKLIFTTASPKLCVYYNQKFVWSLIFLTFAWCGSNNKSWQFLETWLGDVRYGAVICQKYENSMVAIATAARVAIDANVVDRCSIPTLFLITARSTSVIWVCRRLLHDLWFISTSTQGETTCY